MKKILLMAAFVAAGLVNAKNAETKVPKEVQELKTEKSEKTLRLCGVFVTFYDPKGNVTGTQWFLTDAPTISSCQAYQSFVQWNLANSGFTIEP